MNEQAMRFRLGLFVLAALVLLAVLVTLFGGLPTLWKRYRRYTVTFSNAPGIAAGAPVRRSGVRIGQVETVELDGATGKVHVGILVESRYPVTRADRPTLVNGLLGGDASVEFVPLRGRDRTPVLEGETLEGVAQVDVGALLNQASGLMPPAQDTLKGMRDSLHKLDRIAPLVEETLREYRDLARATRALVPKVHGVVGAARETVPDVRGVAKAVQEAVPDFRGVARAALKLAPELQELAREARKDLAVLTREANQAVTEFRRTGAEVQVAVQNWGKLGERLTVLEQTNETKLEKAVDNLNRTLGGVAAVFSEENQRTLRTVLGNVRAGSDRFDSLTRAASELVKEGRLTIQHVNDSVRRVDGVLVNVEEATKPLPKSSRSILKNLEEGSLKVNLLVDELRVLVRWASGDGSLRRFLIDPALYNHLNDAACALTRVLPHLEPILRDVAVFADKIARHPESLGLGGIIRPSTGLKESPSGGVYSHPPGP